MIMQEDTTEGDLFSWKRVVYCFGKLERAEGKGNRTKVRHKPDYGIIFAEDRVHLYLMKKHLLVVLTTLFCQQILAQPSTVSQHIKVDQFGYFPNAKKVAVIADPQAGYNAAEAFSPGTGANQYQIRR